MRARVVAAALGAVAVTTLLAGCDETAAAGHAALRQLDVPDQPAGLVLGRPALPDRDLHRPAHASTPAAAAPSWSSVPRNVATEHWLVSAYTEQNGKQTPLDGAGSTLISDAHTAWVSVPAQLVGGSYVLSVKSTDGRIPTGAWGVVVQVTS